MTANGESVDVVARILAIGGSAINAFGLYFVYLKTRRKVKVIAENARRARTGGDAWDRLSIIAVNTGHRPITITGIGLKFSEGSMLASGTVYTGDSYGNLGAIERSADSDSLPAPLEDGDFTKVYFDYELISQFMSGLGIGVTLDSIYAYDAENEGHKARVNKYLKKKINSLPSLRDSPDSSDPPDS